ncbi:hypothetical protein PSTT_08466 [Puccinia striiformis]|uniref:Uncharacterized protein n=1 Tax=Puccinia striiformis TaxID=27350 RepID=A0A2S4VCL8_9BASI|nr:hypothetical protein PSTT_08466 [Puccinia striiformis]
MCSQARSQTLLNFQPDPYPISYADPNALNLRPFDQNQSETVFHVFCDDDIHQAKSTADIANHRAPKSSTLYRPSLGLRELRRQVGLHHSLRALPLTFDQVHQATPDQDSNIQGPRKSVPQASNENQKNEKITSPHTKSAKRLSSHLYCPSSENTHPGTTQAHDLDNGLNELVSKLEALRTTDEEAYEILEPLPPNATCPGAPKIPSSFTMPLYVADDDCCEDDQVAELKSPISHQMSPLAEVTEAFTGLQGGWSPPLETLSPVMQGHSFDIPPFSYPSTESDGDLIPAQPHTFRRHESVSVSAGPSGEQPTRVRSKGPLRI